MKKFLIGFALFAGLLILLWIIGRVTGALQLYRSPSTGMEPTLKMGSTFLVSNLKRPKRNDIIVFSRILTKKDNYGRPGQKNVFTYRLIAFGNETLEIKNGYAYVNNQLIDDSTKLEFNYLFKKEDAVKVIAELGIDEYSSDINLYNDSIFLNLSYKDYTKVKRWASPLLYTIDFNKGDYAVLFGNDASKKWTINDYGPIKIPKDCYFVLGDNRNGAADSRFVGPIPARNFIGTALKK